MNKIAKKYEINKTSFKRGEVLGYDVTNAESQPIIFSDDSDGFIECDVYDYLLSWRQFVLGVSHGWVRL